MPRHENMTYLLVTGTTTVVAALGPHLRPSQSTQNKDANHKKSDSVNFWQTKKRFASCPPHHLMSLLLRGLCRARFLGRAVSQFRGRPQPLFVDSRASRKGFACPSACDPHRGIK